jgi:hypothetical protein
MGSSRGRMLGRRAIEVAVLYCDPVSLSPLSSSSPETVSEGDSSSGSPLRLYWQQRFFNASCSRAFRT